MSEATPTFYGVNIDTPLSLVHNTGQWDASLIGRLNQETEGQIYIRELQGRALGAEYAWRVVAAQWSQEDSIMTYFRAYGLDGRFLPEAAFGVNYASVPDQIGGGFAYRPEFGNRYYVPMLNSFPTPNVGGYTVQVLDLNYPSEGLAFGMHKQGNQHKALIVSFRLFRLMPGYPNDWSSRVVN